MNEIQKETRSSLSRETLLGKVKEYLGGKVEDFKNHWNPPEEEQQRRALEIIEAIEKTGCGILRKKLEPLSEEEYPDEWFAIRDIITVPLEELTYEEHAKAVGDYEPPEPLSKKKKMALACFTIPVALYAVNLPEMVGAHFFEKHIKPKLNPVLADREPQKLDLEVDTHGYCSADIYSSDGKLLASYKPTGDSTIKITNFSTDLLLGTDCAPGEKDFIKTTQLDARTHEPAVIGF